MNINKKITAWQNAGLISRQQGQLITAFEANQAKPYALYGLLTLAAFCIGLGIISIIAANWAGIAPQIKIGIDFVLLVVSAFGIWHAYARENKNWFEIGIFLYSLLILASIGLIAQIYQLQPNGTSAFLLWSGLVLPLLFFTRRALLPVIWVPVAWYSFLRYLFDNKIAEQTLKMITENWVYALPLLWLFLWCLVWLILSVYFKTYAQGLQKALKFWLIVFMSLMIFILDKNYKDLLLYFSPSASSILSAPVYVASVLSVFALAGIATYICLTNKRYFLPYVMGLMLIGGLVNLSYIISLAALVGAGVYAFRVQNRKLLNFVLILTGFRIFAIYLDVFGSLLTTGAGLIGSGIVLLLVVWGWIKASAYFKWRLNHEN